MTGKDDVIEQKFKEYQDKLVQYIKVYIKLSSAKENINPDLNKKFSNSLFFLLKHEIYPYILNSPQKIREIFSNKINYYNDLNESEEFIKLKLELLKDINKLYSLINLQETSWLELTESSVAGLCIMAIEGLNINYKLENNTEYYKQIVEQIKKDSNFYNLDFDKTCDELCEEINHLKIYTEDNILNIRKVISQYEYLEYPIKIDLINKFQKLIDENDIDEFKYTYIHYIENIKRLKELLLTDFEADGLYFFYLFHKFLNDGSCNGIIDEEKPFKYFICLISVLHVLIHMQNWIKMSNKVSPDIVKKSHNTHQTFKNKVEQDQKVPSNMTLIGLPDAIVNELLKAFKNPLEITFQTELNVKKYYFEKLKTGIDKGKVRVTQVNGGEGLFSKSKVQEVFECLLANQKEKTIIKPKDIIDLCHIKGNKPYDSLKKYINEINSALRGIYKIEGKRELFVKYHSQDKIISRIP